MFIHVFGKMMNYKGLERLTLDLLVFDIEEQKGLLVDVLKNHAKTLKHISFARNKFSNEFLEHVC